MPYTVTGVRSAPDIGAKAVSCPTAETALEMANNYLVSGMRSVEVRDFRGNVYHVGEFDQLAAQERDPIEEGLVERLAALDPERPVQA